MGLSPQLITSELYKKATECLQTLSQNNRASIRLRAIVSAKEHGVGVVAKVFGVSDNTLRSWVKSFASDGLPGLNYKSGRGRRSNLSAMHIEAIRGMLEEDCNITINAIVIKLKQAYDVNTSVSAVHRAVGKLNYSYITPRAVHHKQDKSSHPEFKKKSGNVDAE